MKLDARTAPIHTALEAHLEPKDLAYALRLWSEQFIEDPNISLKEFVESFYTRQPMEMRSHELYNHLLPAMMEAFKVRASFSGELIEPYEFPDYDLGTTSTEPLAVELPQPEVLPVVETPEPSLSVEMVATEEEVIMEEPRIERYEAFSLFMRSLCNKIPTDRREKLLERYGSEIKGCCVYPVGSGFLEWLMGDADYFEDEGLATDDMSNITHLIYMGMCDYLGPVQADNVLNHAVSIVDNRFPSGKFDINSLL